MSHIQISFLGAPQRKGGAFVHRGDYQRACYRFPDGALATESLFALALAKHHRPDAVLLLGTPGSAWHSLIDWAGYPEDRLGDAESLYSSLDPAVKAQATSAAEIAALEALLQPVEGIPWRLRLIPNCENDSEFQQLLALIAKEVRKGDSVTFDVTHGLRHLPILALIAGLYLRQVREVTVRGILYGALELSKAEPSLEGPVAPVLSLSGVLETARWLDAISRFRASGDYGQFASLLSGDTKSLKRASYYQRSGQISRLQPEVETLRESLAQQQSNVFRLFEPFLRESLALGDMQNAYRFQRQVALASLDRRDYLHTSIYAVEAFKTRISGIDGTASFEERQECFQRFLQGEGTHAMGFRHDDTGRMREYAKQLNRIRNALAHAGEPNVRSDFEHKHGDPLRDENSLREFLDTTIRLLLPDSAGGEE